MKRTYGLPQSPSGLDHGLAYEAIAAGQIDVMDIYSTDAKIAKYKLRVLADDKHYFPEYAALFVYRLDVPKRFPKAWAALARLEGRIDEPAMIAMNAQAELDGKPFAVIAEAFLATQGNVTPVAQVKARLARVAVRSGFLAVDRPTSDAGVRIAGSGRCDRACRSGCGQRGAPAAAQPILGSVSVIQTIPSLALLAFLIPLLGMIGTVPALVALFLYSRCCPSCATPQRPHRYLSAACGNRRVRWGCRRSTRLRLIELPLASRSILAGVKTAAVISVGTATIAAFIGAGGYGERIVTGLRTERQCRAAGGRGAGRRARVAGAGTVRGPRPLVDPGRVAVSGEVQCAET